jgi:two-component system sensor histidine kinase/response regulator
MSQGPKVLIVDDRPENLLALEAVLESLDVDVVRADSGEAALRRLLTDEVAVIILDVQMPGLDGFETAAHIKERDKTRRIPIIFLTALSTDISHALRGYETGAVDYISKPFEPDVLRAKVSVFADLHRYAKLIEEQRELLALRLDERDQAQAALARQAAELERSNAELERFATVLSNDLGEPLYVVGGFLDLLRDGSAEELGEKGRLMVDKAALGVTQLFSRIDELLAYARATSDVVEPTTVDLGDVFDDVQRNLASRLAEMGIELSCDPLPKVSGDPWQLRRLFNHVIGHGLAQPGTTEVHVGVSREDEAWTFSVRDDSDGIDDAQVAGLFSLLAAGSSAGESGALDLPIARRIVEHHGGTIRAQSVPGRGTTISFTLIASG